MMFEEGDAIVHPIRGVGVVVQVEERQWHGSNSLYYRVKLLNEEDTELMISVDLAKGLGLRRAIPRSKLKQVWRALCADPNKLPSNHKKRYKLVEDKLHAGDVFQVIEVVRDMAWRQRQEGRLNTMGKRMYDEGIGRLAGEIATAQNIDIKDAEVQLRAKLSESLPPAPA